MPNSFIQNLPQGFQYTAANSNMLLTLQKSIASPGRYDYSFFGVSVNTCPAISSDSSDITVTGDPSLTSLLRVDLPPTPAAGRIIPISVFKISMATSNVPSSLACVTLDTVPGTVQPTDLQTWFTAAPPSFWSGTSFHSTTEEPLPLDSYAIFTGSLQRHGMPEVPIPTDIAFIYPYMYAFASQTQSQSIPITLSNKTGVLNLNVIISGGTYGAKTKQTTSCQVEMQVNSFVAAVPASDSSSSATTSAGSHAAHAHGTSSSGKTQPKSTSSSVSPSSSSQSPKHKLSTAAIAGIVAGVVVVIVVIVCVLLMTRRKK
jgi:hypothetical protein